MSVLINSDISFHLLRQSLFPCVETYIKGHENMINCIAFDKDEKRLVSGSDDKSIIIWTLDGKQPFHYKLNGHSDAVLSLAIGDQYLFSSSNDHYIRLWRLSQFNDSDSESYHSDGISSSSLIRSVDIKKNSTQFFTADQDRTIKIWSTGSNIRMTYIKTLP